MSGPVKITVLISLRALSLSLNEIAEQIEAEIEAGHPPSDSAIRHTS